MRITRLHRAFSSLPLALAACIEGTSISGTDGDAPDASSDSVQTSPAIIPDPPSAATTGGSTTETDEPPCSRCAVDEFCLRNGNNDIYADPTQQVSCEPLPEGCTRSELCTLECVHEICGTYGCRVSDSSKRGEAIVCVDRCDPWLESPCLVDGTVCTLISNNGDLFADKFACVPAPAPGAPVGAPCTVTSDGRWSWGDCVEGAVCRNFGSDGSQGVCKALCTGSGNEPVCADPDTICNEYLWNYDGLYLCEERCDPLAGAAACPPGEVCTGYPDPSCSHDASGEDGAYGDPCPYANSCDPGLFCANAEVVPLCDPAEYTCCTPYCDLSQPACPPELTCVLLHEQGSAPAGLENLGVCVVPL